MLQGSSIQEQSKIVFDEKDDLSMVSQNGLVTSDRRSLMVPTLVTNQAGAYVKSEQTVNINMSFHVIISYNAYLEPYDLCFGVGMQIWH